MDTAAMNHLGYNPRSNKLALQQARVTRAKALAGSTPKEFATEYGVDPTTALNVIR